MNPEIRILNPECKSSILNSELGRMRKGAKMANQQEVIKFFMPELATNDDFKEVLFRLNSIFRFQGIISIKFQISIWFQLSFLICKPLKQEGVKFWN